MDVTEAQALIDLVAGLDRRPFRPGAAEAWQFVLADVYVGDALQAVREHYAAESKAITPALVRHRALEIRAARQRARARRSVASRPEVRTAALAAMRAEAARASAKMAGVSS